LQNQRRKKKIRYGFDGFLEKMYGQARGIKKIPLLNQKMLGRFRRENTTTLELILQKALPGILHLSHTETLMVLLHHVS